MGKRLLGGKKYYHCTVNKITSNLEHILLFPLASLTQSQGQPTGIYFYNPTVTMANQKQFPHSHHNTVWKKKKGVIYSLSLWKLML